MFMERVRGIARVVIALAFIGAGLNHFLNEQFYVAIMPPYLPAHLELVYISGVFEVAGGIGLLITRLRKTAGYGLMLLTLAVFPANFHMALHPELYVEIASATALTIRLPLQLVILAWLYWVSRTRVPESE